MLILADHPDNPVPHDMDTQADNRTADLRDRFRFFLAHAGYATPPGRAACALELARAEQWAEDTGIAHSIEPDDNPDNSWMELESDSYRSRMLREGCWQVVLVSPNGKPMYQFALGGIWGDDEAYFRVVAAELASEMRAQGIVFPQCH